MNYRNLIFLLLVTISISSCVTTVSKLAKRKYVLLDSYGVNGEAPSYNSNERVIANRNLSDSDKIGGIKESINLMKAGEELSVIMIHGVNTKRISAFDLSVAILRQNLNTVPVAQYLFTIPDSESEFQSFGDGDETWETLMMETEDPIIRVFIDKVTTDSGTGEERFVKYYCVIWSNVNFEHKTFAQYSDADREVSSISKDDLKYATDDDRELGLETLIVPSAQKFKRKYYKKINKPIYKGLNRGFEQTLMNDGLADVAASSSPSNRLKIFRAFETCMQLVDVDVSQFQKLRNSIDTNHVKNYLYKLDPSLDGRRANYMKYSDIVKSKEIFALASKVSFVKDSIEQNELISNKVFVITGSFGTSLFEGFLSGYPKMLAEGKTTLPLSGLNSPTIYLSSIDYRVPHRSVIIPVRNYQTKNRLDYAISLSNKSIIWYSLSNQLGLLSALPLGCEQLETNSYDPDFQERQDLIVDQFVAFYDPNDLLGYRFPTKDMQALTNFNSVQRARSYNIQLPIQPSRLLLRNPDLVHSTSKYHPYVQQIIANGWKGDPTSLVKYKFNRFQYCNSGCDEVTPFYRPGFFRLTMKVKNQFSKNNTNLKWGKGPKSELLSSFRLVNGWKNQAYSTVVYGDLIPKNRLTSLRLEKPRGKSLPLNRVDLFR